MSQDDLDYLLKRAVEEQVAAQNAGCPEARRRHEELAMLYRFRSLRGRFR